jgi:O-antigen ligase
VAKSRSQSKKAAAALDAAAAKAPARRADDDADREPASPWPVLLSRAAFILTLALVIARALMSETIRAAMDVTPGGMPAPAAPGPASTLFLNALCCLPAILVLVRRTIERPFVLRWTWSQALFALLALCSAASVTWSADKFTAVVYASTFFAAAALAWSTAQLVRSWMRLRLVAGVCVGLLLAYAVQGLIYKFIDVPDNIEFWNKNKEQILREHNWDENSFQAQQFARKLIGGEMVGFNTSPNSYAAIIVMLSVITVGAAIQRRKSGDEIAWSIALLLPLLPALLALYFTHTRTAAGTLVLAAVALALLSLRGVPQWLAAHSRLAYIGFVVIAMLGVATVVGHGLHHGSLPGASLNFRWRYWVAGWSIFTQDPLTGVGWGNFGNYYVSTRLAAAAEEARDPHNFIVRTFVELGLVGGALALAWIARAAWELSRPISPPTPAAAAATPAPASSVTSAVGTILAIAVSGAVLNMAIAIDWSQDVNFLIYESFRRILFLGLMIVAMALVAIRGRQNQSIDDRPAPWLLYATLIGLAVFFIHNLVDFVLAEPGALTLFATILGAALGLRTPPAAGLRPRRTVATIVTMAAILAWLVAMLTLVIPVSDAEQRARDADVQIRGDRSRGVPSRPDVAAKMFESIFQSVPYNADYAFRAARAHMMAGSPPAKVTAMLGIAIATEPTNVGYRLTRAGVELRQPQPDVGMIRQDYDAAVRLDPHNMQGRLDYAHALDKFGDPAAAAAQIRRALDTNRQYDPTEPERLPPEEVARLEDLAARLEANTTRPTTSPAQ